MNEYTLIPSFEKSIDIKGVLKNNFRVQESWGLWLLSHQSQIKFFSHKNQLVVLDMRASLPYSNQDLRLYLNDNVVFETHSSKHVFFPVEISALLSLREGENKLVFSTNKSNRDNKQLPFAKKDSSDLSLSLNRFYFFSPDLESGKDFFGQTLSIYPNNTYIPIGNNGIQMPFLSSGKQQLNYTFLRRTVGQVFLVKLDGKSIYTIGNFQKGNLLSGVIDLNIKSSNKQHIIQISSVPQDSSKKIDDFFKNDSDEVSFYVEKIYISHSSNPFGFYVSLISIVSILSLFLLYLLLFRRKL